MIQREYEYKRLGDLSLKIKYERLKNSKKNMPIFYFHGGGLIYGEKEDLPEVYRQQFLESGYSLVEVDYPFIPEVKIDTILMCLKEALRWWIGNHNKECLTESDEWIYFGRSAGAYLALLLSNQEDLPKPRKIISLYGYPTLEDSRLQQPSGYYQSFPPVPFMDYYSLIQSKPICSVELSKRFSLYVAYRQTGNWIKEILGKNDIKDYGLNKKQLEHLPPVFIAASRQDQDIPFEISEEMSQLIPDNYFFPIDENLPHDFDNNTTIPVGRQVYQKILEWLEK